ncbi:EscU/YscU/HrcU family type III secretion system export apparatus switch protein [Thiomicrospira sp. ALE5]|uniref:EscU/YscU/HrcU family type III secretion system export apparatus switch protein n=1 Tax=Thiomicrospira sp. ALE5 TaxID=748650 RepID=UPI0008E26870|nr:EscU/YscU/HrcU family type III secretion system export apparatus switch protein [Thiomicrospira sp. ALE5]SFR49679.1 flagellar biosynthesis protein [Thiomicrospira sp. ALE5]
MSKTQQHQAIALQYDEGDLPRVTASGQGRVAEQIIQRANEHNIPLYQDADLTAALAQLPLESRIPKPLFHAVAQVLAFAHHVNQQQARSN